MATEPTTLCEALVYFSVVERATKGREPTLLHPLSYGRKDILTRHVIPNRSAEPYHATYDVTFCAVAKF
jgi:hypothetical protein